MDVSVDLNRSSSVDGIVGKTIKLFSGLSKTTAKLLSYGVLIVGLNLSLGYGLAKISDHIYLKDEIFYANELNKSLEDKGYNNPGDVGRIGFHVGAIGMLRGYDISASPIIFTSNYKTCQINLNTDLTNEGGLNYFSLDKNTNIFFTVNHESAHCHSMMTNMHYNVQGLNEAQNKILSKLVTDVNNDFWTNDIGLLTIATRAYDYFKGNNDSATLLMYTAIQENYADLRALMVLANSTLSDEGYKNALTDIFIHRSSFGFLFNGLGADSSGYSDHESVIALTSFAKSFSRQQIKNMKPADINRVAYEMAVNSVLIQTAGTYSDADFINLKNDLIYRGVLDKESVSEFNNMFKTAQNSYLNGYSYKYNLVGKDGSALPIKINIVADPGLMKYRGNWESATEKAEALDMVKAVSTYMATAVDAMPPDEIVKTTNPKNHKSSNKK